VIYKLQPVIDVSYVTCVTVWMKNKLN